MSAGERSGWRDAEFSEHRRIWGRDVPADDIDSFGLDDTDCGFNMVEYDRLRPKVLVEYTHWQGEDSEKKVKKSNALMMTWMANKLEVPFLIVKYWPGSWVMEVMRVNEFAMKQFGQNGRASELQYVTGLYRQRGRVIPESVVPLLKTTKTPLADISWSASA